MLAYSHSQVKGICTRALRPIISLLEGGAENSRVNVSSVDLNLLFLIHAMTYVGSGQDQIFVSFVTQIRIFFEKILFHLFHAFFY